MVTAKRPTVVDNTSSKIVIVGRIGAPYGIKGWVKIQSNTEPKENILNYSPWLININNQWQAIEFIEGRKHGKTVVAHLRGCDDIDQAARFTNLDIAISREQLPEIEQDEYYWTDLEGLDVINKEGVKLGKVIRLMETGANDILVVKGEKERLIPYLPGRFVLEVDLDKGSITVDWDPEF